MDVREMAYKYLDEVHDERIDYREDIFIAGYNAACEWKDMSTAPKDGTHILLAQEWGDVGIGYWHKMGPYDCDTEEWCIQDSFNSESESLSVFIDPVAWMPLPKYTHKP